MQVLIIMLTDQLFVSSGSSTASSSTSPHPVVRPIGSSTLHELLLRRCENPFTNPVSNQVDNTSAGGGKPKVSRLSMSAPTQTMALDQIWAHREPRQHLLSTSSLVEAGSTSSLSTGGALSPDPLSHLDAFNQDEDYEDSDDDSDHYDDYSSENGTYISLICHNMSLCLEERRFNVLPWSFSRERYAIRK